MHRDAFEFEADSARTLDDRVDFDARERFDRRAVRPRVRDARVTRDGLDELGLGPRVTFMSYTPKRLSSDIHRLIFGNIPLTWLSFGGAAWCIYASVPRNRISGGTSLSEARLRAEFQRCGRVVV